jgi:hypothetical protein
MKTKEDFDYFADSEEVIDVERDNLVGIKEIREKG